MRGFRWLGLIACLLLVPTLARAQGSIAGLVRDSSGAVLPGVRVEAESPALIEKARSVTTDAAGQYQIIDLRPGTYTVTFALSGFATVRREGIVLTGSFTATVNAELLVGAVEESVTVTSEVPTVDLQNTRRSNVVPAAVIEGLPASRSQYTMAVLIPGATGFGSQYDVGGTQTMSIQSFSVHGSRSCDQRMMINGLTSRNLLAAACASNFVPDMGTASEVVVDYSSATAESYSGGVSINVIPKEGGNTFSGLVFATGANSSFQGNNYSDELRNAGLSSPNKLHRLYDINLAGGGPIVRNRLWFYSSIRWQESSFFPGGVFHNKNAGDLTKWTYEPDFSQPAEGILTIKPNYSVRLTWQATPRNKIGFSAEPDNRYWIAPTTNMSPEVYPEWIFNHESFTTATWQSPLTNRLLLDAKFANHAEGFVDKYPDPGDPFRRAIPVLDQSNGFRFRGKGYCCTPFVFFGTQNAPFIMQAQASAAYVTGSHAFKVGFQNDFGTVTQGQFDNEQGLFYTFLNGVPVSLEQHALPFDNTAHLSYDLGVYAQDRWTYKRATINAGVRFDYFDTYFPEQRLGPASFVPNRNIVIPRTDYNNMKDVTPRIGVAFDLFGNGKTSVKTAWGKYLVGANPQLGNPVQNLAYIARRSWTPSLPPGNANYYTPQCDLLNPAANGDCGPLDNQLFGQLRPSAAVDPRTYTGWGNRDWNQEFSASIQHEIVPRVAIDFGYFRRWYGNFRVVDNRAVSAGDFTRYSITVPTDSRLAQSGQVINGLYEVAPAKVGQVDNYTTLAGDFGKQIEHWNGFDLTINARARRGVILQGGMSTGRTSTDNCEIRNVLPEITVVAGVIAVPDAYCHVDTNFLTQFKFLGTYLVPKIDLQFGVTLRALPGPEIQGNYAVTSAQTQPRTALAGGIRLVNLVPPGTQYLPYINQLDLRFSKIFRTGRFKTSVNLDVANVTNSNATLSVVSNYGSRWLVPTAILDARLLKLGAQFDF